MFSCAVLAATGLNGIIGGIGMSEAVINNRLLSVIPSGLRYDQQTIMWSTAWC
jgi:hypothetical protein